MTTDAAGNVFALGRSNGIVYKITPAGQISTVVDLPDGDEGYVGPIVDQSTGNLFVSRNMHRSGTETPDHSCWWGERVRKAGG